MKHLFRKISAVGLIMVLFVTAITSTKLNTVSAADVLVSPEISVVGYQMKTDVSSGEGVTFRTVCKAPDIGSVITVNGKNYTITNLGTIYAKDPNRSGKVENKVLDKSYTELDTNPYPQSAIKDGYGFKYIGQKLYRDEIVTFGYIATEKGTIEKKDGYTSYIRTMTNMDNFVLNTLYVRAFVEAVDEDGNETIIYGEYAGLVSVAEIAYKVYTEGKAPSAEGHKYLYDTILNKLPTTNPFYKDTEEEYGWGAVVKP